MKRLLCVSTIPTHPEVAGNRSRVRVLLERFERQGVEVRLLYIHDQSLPPECNVDAMQDHWTSGVYFHAVSTIYDRNENLCKEFLRSIKRVVHSIEEEYRPDVVLLVYPFLSSILKFFHNDTFTLIDTLDVFADRNGKLERHNIQVPRGMRDFSSGLEEKQTLEKADGILAIQEKDFLYFQELQNTPVHLIEHMPLQRTACRERGASKKLLFIASRSYVGKRNLTEFLTCYLPVLLKHSLSLEVVIAGDIASILDARLPSVCKVVGRCSNLQSLYTSVDLAISTEVYATGLSIKNVTALAHALPLVTTTPGARGIEFGSSQAFLVADSPQEFSEHIIRLLDNPHDYERVSGNAVTFCDELDKRICQSIDALCRTVVGRS